VIPERAFIAGEVEGSDLRLPRSSCRMEESSETRPWTRRRLITIQLSRNSRRQLTETTRPQQLYH